MQEWYFLSSHSVDKLFVFWNDWLVITYSSKKYAKGSTSLHCSVIFYQ